MSMKTKRKTKHHPRGTTSRKFIATNDPKPFHEHLYELRRRAYYIGLFVLLFGAGAYFIQQHIVSVLMRPAHGQHFIYTNPGGGLDFLFRICLYVGLVLSTPVVVYNALEFLQPLMSRSSKRFTTYVSIACGLLAIAGVIFGYFIGLPAALHFLFHQFTNIQISPLITIQSYLSFVIAYLLGAALLFQLPLILICINRIKPLKPKQLLHYERWVILSAFVLAGLMNPSPNLLSQLVVVLPFIVVYHIGILIITVINRPRYSSPIRAKFEEDAKVQIEREKLRQQTTSLVDYQALSVTPKPFSPPQIFSPASSPASPISLAPKPAYRKHSSAYILPRRSFMDFIPPSNTASNGSS